MTWKIVSYRRLPMWARMTEYRRGRLYIIVRYRWNWVRTCPLTLRTFIRTMKEARKYRCV